MKVGIVTWEGAPVTMHVSAADGWTGGGGCGGRRLVLSGCVLHRVAHI